MFTILCCVCACLGACMRCLGVYILGALVGVCTCIGACMHRCVHVLVHAYMPWCMRAFACVCALYMPWHVYCLYLGLFIRILIFHYLTKTIQFNRKQFSVYPYF